MYYVYMIRCEDNSIYTGITTDIERRFKEHLSKDKKCAKYTLTHTVINIESIWKTEDKVLASKLEYHIKKLPKIKKEELIKSNNLEKLLGRVIDSSKYEKVNISILK